MADYYCDGLRHLICVPYTIAGLHVMARELGIKRCWYHGSATMPHYDIPKRDIERIQRDPRVRVVRGVELYRLTGGRRQLRLTEVKRG